MIIADKKKQMGSILARMDAAGHSKEEGPKEQDEPSSKMVLAARIRDAIQGGSDQDLVDALDAYLEEE